MFTQQFTRYCIVNTEKSIRQLSGLHWLSYPAEVTDEIWPYFLPAKSGLSINFLFYFVYCVHHVQNAVRIITIRVIIAKIKDDQLQKKSQQYFRCSLCLQCFDTVGWVAGRASTRKKKVKKWVVGCWRCYLSGVRCRLAYGPADATATHCLLLQ